MDEWLEKEAEGKSVLWYSLDCFVLIFLFVNLSIVILYLFNIHIPPVPAAKTLFAQPVNLVLVLAILIGALVEEILFRFPLSILGLIGAGPQLTLLGACILSGIFGWCHGGVSHVLIQGPFGFLLSMLYLKCGGYQGNVVKALFTTTLVHAGFNLFLVIGTKL